MRGGGNGGDKGAYRTVAVGEETARLSIFEGAKASKIVAFTLGWKQQILGAGVVLLMPIYGSIK